MNNGAIYEITETKTLLKEDDEREVVGDLLSSHDNLSPKITIMRRDQVSIEAHNDVRCLKIEVRDTQRENSVITHIPVEVVQALFSAMGVRHKDTLNFAQQVFMIAEAGLCDINALGDQVPPLQHQRYYEAMMNVCRAQYPMKIEPTEKLKAMHRLQREAEKRGNRRVISEISDFFADEGEQ